VSTFCILQYKSNFFSWLYPSNDCILGVYAYTGEGWRVRMSWGLGGAHSALPLRGVDKPSTGQTPGIGNISCGVSFDFTSHSKSEAFGSCCSSNCRSNIKATYTYIVINLLMRKLPSTTWQLAWGRHRVRLRYASSRQAGFVSADRDQATFPLALSGSSFFTSC